VRPSRISPQWVRHGRRFSPASPGIFRGLLNAFYASVHAVDPTNLVVTAGTAPFGDPHPGDRRIPPALFTREFLCVSGRRVLRPHPCPGGPSHFDALAHHPYPLGSPPTHALNPDDVVIADLSRLTRPLAVALRAGNVLPAGPKQLWATELSWDSSPPDPQGVPVLRQARYLEGALYVLWREGVDEVTWFLLRDAAKGRGYPFTLQSGIYFRATTVAADRPKPSFTAFRFPFTAYRRHGVATLWGLAPVAPGTVVVQERRRGGWVTVRSLKAGANRVFLGSLRIGRGRELRAVEGSDVSIVWRTI